MFKFENIKNIRLNDDKTWKNKIFLTFDIDWCSDEVLGHTLDIIENENIKATFFVTHETKLLDRMRSNNNLEIGIHPNFNPLLMNDCRYGENAEEVIQFYKNIVPEALSVRSHSMAQSSVILDTFDENALVFDCNTFIPFSSKIINFPYKHWTDNLIKVPYFWEDDVSLRYNHEFNLKMLLDYKGIKVFDFHPIHIFLNTEDLDRYENSRKVQNDSRLHSHINNKNYGINNCLFDLINGVISK